MLFPESDIRVPRQADSRAKRAYEEVLFGLEICQPFKCENSRWKNTKTEGFVPVEGGRPCSARICRRIQGQPCH